MEALIIKKKKKKQGTFEKLPQEYSKGTGQVNVRWYLGWDYGT